MHDSKFLSENAVCELYETLVSACGNKVRIAVRTPMQHRFIMKYLTRYMGTGNADTDTDNAYMDTDILRPMPEGARYGLIIRMKSVLMRSVEERPYMTIRLMIMITR